MQIAYGNHKMQLAPPGSCRGFLVFSFSAHTLDCLHASGRGWLLRMVSCVSTGAGDVPS